MSAKESFNEYLNSHQLNIISNAEIEEIISVLTNATPSITPAEKQKLYRYKSKYECRVSHETKELYLRSSSIGTGRKLVGIEDIYDAIHSKHCEGGKHLGRDRLFAEINKYYYGITRTAIQIYLNGCTECQLQKSKNSIKGLVTKPIRSNDFASRGQVDLIDFQSSDDVNIPYKYLLVYKDHLTKFVVLRPLTSKTAEEVALTLKEIFCLIGPPHILQSDNGKEFRNVNLATLVNNMWHGGCKIVHGKPRHPQSQGSVERANQEIKKVLGSIMREKNSRNWVQFVPDVQFSINTSPHSANELKSPYRVLFGRDPSSLLDLGISASEAECIDNSEELNSLFSPNEPLLPDVNDAVDLSPNNLIESPTQPHQIVFDQNPTCSFNTSPSVPLLDSQIPGFESQLNTLNTSLSNDDCDISLDSYIRDIAAPNFVNYHEYSEHTNSSTILDLKLNPICSVCHMNCNIVHSCLGCENNIHDNNKCSQSTHEGLWCNNCIPDMLRAEGRRAAKRDKKNKFTK